MSEGVRAADEILYAPGRDVDWGSGNGWYLAHGNDSAPANAQPVLTDSGEWRLLPPPLSEEYARIQRAFNAFDVDGSGTISASEMKAILSRCNAQSLGKDADACVVVGAGCARCNGSYVHGGAYKNRALYECSSTGLQIWFNEGEWRLGSTRDYYYVSAGERVDEPVWRVATGDYANAGTAEAAPTMTLAAWRGLSASDIDALISEFDENGDGELDTREFIKACCGLDTRLSTRMLDICVDCGRKVKVETMIEARDAERQLLREACYAHAYKAPDVWLRTVLVDAVCAVPADVWEEGPPADWQASIVKLLEQCRLFHSSARAFGATSTMRWRLRGPAPMPLTAAQYREKSNWFWHFREHIRTLDEGSGIEIVAESWQFSDIAEEAAPTYTVQCVFADWGCNAIPSSVPYDVLAEEEVYVADELLADCLSPASPERLDELSRLFAPVVVAGAGCARCNGSYGRAGSYAGHPMYECQDSGLQVWFHEGEWRLGKTYDYYYVSPGESVDEPRWQVATKKANADTADPAPTVALHL